MPFVPSGWATGFSLAPAAGNAVKRHRRSSHGLVRSYRVLRAPSHRTVRAPSRAPANRAAPSMRFFAPSASPRSQQHHMDGFASPGRLRPQVFSTSRRVDPPRACRPCFMPDPLMGLHPPELFSYRLAVRRLRRRSPPDVGSTRMPSRPSQPELFGYRSTFAAERAVLPSHRRSAVWDDQLRHSSQRQASRIPGARDVLLRRNRNHGGVERTVLLLPRPEGLMGTERSRPAPSATRRSRRNRISRPSSSEDRSPLRNPPKARILRTPPRTEILTDALEGPYPRRMPPEAETSAGPNVRSRRPREHRRLQGFDPRGNPPLTLRLFRPGHGA